MKMWERGLSVSDSRPGRARKLYSFDDLAADLNVSRETLEALKLYGDLLTQWQQKFNLVSRSSIPDMWHRHFLDSAQILDYAPKTNPVWMDFGSGAGFPGLVVAILLRERGGGVVHVVESTGKKAKFLQEVVDRTIGRDTGVEVHVHRERVEEMDLLDVDVISARALASLNRLFTWSHRFAGPESIFLFPKGQDVDQELTEAAKYWNIDLDKYSSRTDPQAVILRVNHLTPKDAPRNGKRNRPRTS